MNTVLEKKRQSYLVYFLNGLDDALFRGERDPTQNSSAYYKQGYQAGLIRRGWLDEKHGEETL